MKNRNRDILAMRNAGNTFPEIGRELGISAKRANQLYYSALSKQRRGKELPEWTDGLSAKVVNALIAAGFNSKEQVIEGLSSGIIGIIPGTTKGTVFGIAQQGIQEIALWSGVVAPEQLEITKAIKLLELNGYKVIKNTDI